MRTESQRSLLAAIPVGHRIKSPSIGNDDIQQDQLLDIALDILRRLRWFEHHVLNLWNVVDCALSLQSSSSYDRGLYNARIAFIHLLNGLRRCDSDDRFRHTCSQTSKHRSRSGEFPLLRLPSAFDLTLEF